MQDFDEHVVLASLSGNMVMLKGVGKGSSAVTIRDIKSKQSVSLQVRVTDEQRFEWVASRVVEARSIAPDGHAVDIASEKVQAIWGDRLAFNTPIALRLTADSLYIVKLNDVVEKYRAQWCGEKLYLARGLTDQWKFCGQRDAENHTFTLNLGLLKGSVRNDARVLEFLQQGYDYESVTQVVHLPQCAIVWTRMHFIFKRK